MVKYESFNAIAQLVLCVVLMCAFWLIQFSFGDSKMLENRKLAELPQVINNYISTQKITTDMLYSFGSETDSFFDDRFPLRNKILDRFKYSQIAINQGMSPVDTVTMGKNGFYFHNAPHQIKYIENELYTEEELEQVVQVMLERQQFVNDHGKQFYMVIAGVKSDVYPENLPDNWPKFARESNPKTRGDQVVTALQKAGINVYYTLPYLQELKKEREVFYPLDTHWNPYGAYMSYEKMWSQFDPTVQIPQIEKDLTIVEDPDLKSDLQKMMGTTLIPEAGYKYQFADMKGTQTQPLHVIQAEPNSKSFYEHKAFYNPTKNRDVLVFHTSYHIQLEPLYQETFRDVQMYKLVLDFSPKLVQESKAEIVVQEISTHDFNYLPNDYID
jgi:alginate O-acetyltransferase complex protein AlgJ